MAWFKYSCFLGYRHGQYAIKHRFIDDFCLALSGELELLRNEPLFVDRDRLRPGDYHNPSLARAVHDSVCMVVIYQPNYFDSRHIYCAREYRGMCELERQRLSLLADPAERNHSLIIPVILRGKDSLPPQISDSRYYEDFSKFMLTDIDLAKHPSFAPSIRKIATYIQERCRSLDGLSLPEGSADRFELPSEESTQEWLRSVTLPTNEFPGTREA